MTLRVRGRDVAAFRRAVDAHAAAWPGGDVGTTWLGLPELQADVLGPEAVDADVLIVPADWLPALAAAGRIRPLTGFLADAPPEGWPDAWSPSFHQGVTWAGDVYGLPFHDGPQLLFTRPSLLAAPATWSQLLEGAHRLHAPGEASAGTVPAGTVLAGTVLAGAPDGHNNVYDFALHLWRFGGQVTRLDSGAARAALRFLRTVATTLVAGNAHDLDSGGSGEEFAAGRVAVAVNWAGYAALAAEGAVAGDFAVGLAPTHDDGTPTTTVNAFWASVVTGSCPDPARAWDYLRHAASAPMDLGTTLAGASGTRRSTWTHPDVLSRRPEHALFDAAHANSRPLPRIPELPAVVDALSDLVDAVVWRGEALEPALAAAGRRVDDLLGVR